MNSKRKDGNKVNSTCCLTTTLFTIHAVVGSWFEEEPSRIVNTRTSTVDMSMIMSDTLLNYHLQPPTVLGASH